MPAFDLGTAYEAILLSIYSPFPGGIMWTPSAEGKRGHVTFLADEIWTDLPCAALGRSWRVSEGSAQSPVSLPWQLVMFQVVPAPSAWVPDTGQWQSTIEGEHGRYGPSYRGLGIVTLVQPNRTWQIKDLLNLGKTHITHLCIPAVQSIPMWARL